MATGTGDRHQVECAWVGRDDCASYINSNGIGDSEDANVRASGADLVSPGYGRDGWCNGFGDRPDFAGCSVRIMAGTTEGVVTNWQYCRFWQLGLEVPATELVTELVTATAVTESNRGDRHWVRCFFASAEGCGEWEKIADSDGLGSPRQVQWHSVFQAAVNFAGVAALPK